MLHFVGMERTEAQLEIYVVKKPKLKEFYGKLASHVMNNGSSTSTENLLPNIQQAVQGPPTAKAMSQPPGKDQTGKTTSRPKILISLKRNSGETWSSTQHQPETVKDAVLPPATSPACPAPTPVNPVVASVAENVSQFLNGIRATFRQDNVIVNATDMHQRKGLAKQNINDGK